MISEETAKHFAVQWINAWNSHSIENILEHYDEEIEFYSPLIPLLKFNDEGVIRNKSDLKKYFEIGLKAYPDLNFKFHHCFVGINSVVLHYTSVNGRIAAEVFEFNGKGKVSRVLCNYSK